MSEIIFLGTAGAVASGERDNTSLLIRSKNDLILIDAAGGLVKKLAQVNLDFRMLSQIFLTHGHSDHIYGLVSLLHSQYGLKNKVHIFAHQKVIGLVKTLRRIFKLTDTTKFPEVIYHKIEANPKISFYNSPWLAVYAFKVRHSSESLGFRFLFKSINKSCVFSGDTARESNLIKVSSGCDYLIHDCFAPERYFIRYPQLKRMHTSSLSLGEIASESNVKVLVPIHFASEVKYSIREIIKEIKRNFSGKLIIPSDLQALKIN